MVKRILAAFLCMLMLVSLTTACQGDTQKQQNSTSDSQTDGKVDLTQKREVEITLLSNAFITSFDDNELTKRIEEDLNCNITFNLLPAGDALSKLQLMINGGDELTDIISCNLSSALTYEYGSGGTFIPLNKYFSNENIMPNYNAIESEEDKMSMQNDVMSADGNIYALSQFNPEPWNLTPYRLYMNMTWLDNLGLEVPTTSEELKNVLTAFATKDPNGNGTNDEISLLSLYANSNYGCNVILALINMFEYTGGTMSSFTLSEDGKTVIAPQTMDGWKEAMKYLNSLYQAGALTDNSFVYDQNSYKSLLNYQGIGTEKAEPGKSVNVVGLFTVGSNNGNFVDSGVDKNVNYLEYQMIPVPEGPDGKAYSPYLPYSPAPYWYVTSYAEDPDFCVMMGDWFYETNHSMWARYGLEEVDWTMDEQFCADWYEEHTKLIESKGYEQMIDGYYSLVRLRADVILGEPNSNFWYNVQPRYASLEFFNHVVDYFDPETFEYYNGNYERLSNISKEYYGDAHPEHVLPVLAYTNEEQSAITQTQVAYPDVITEWTMRFITGEKNPETDWQEYLDALNSIGLQDYLEVTQTAYERTASYQAKFG